MLWPGSSQAQGPRPTDGGLSAAKELPPAADAPPTQKRPRPRHPRFSEQWLVPYLGRGAAATARAALLAGRPRKAAQLLRRYLAAKGAAQPHQARFLLATALLRSNKHAAAAALFTKLEREYPLLADYHRYYQARAHHRLKQYDQALAAAARVSPASPLRLDAQLLQADTLWATGKKQRSAALWRSYLRGRKSKAGRWAEAHFRLGQATLARAATAATPARRQLLRKEALGHFKSVDVNRPLSPLAADARKQIQRLRRQDAKLAPLARLTQWEHQTRAMALYHAMRNRQAEQAFATLLRDKKLKPMLRCVASYHRARAVFRQRQRARAEPMFRQAEQACRRVRKWDLVVKSLYNGARGLTRKGRFLAAVKRFARIEKEFPKHTYGDDARLRAAEAYVEAGKHAAARKLLSTLPARHPGGDMVREALWRLALDDYLNKRYRAALRHLERIIRELGRADKYYAHGRALYWKARILERQRRPRRARKVYQQCIEQYPLSYYALQSFNRLRDNHIAAFKRLVVRKLNPTGKQPGRWSFGRRALFGEPAFLRGVELARLGLAQLAARELASTGLKIGRATDSRDLWLAAVLYDRAGLWRFSHQVPRSLDRRYRWTYPLKDNYRRWIIAYPRAFWPLVQQHAGKARIPWNLVLAVMREESGFTPTIESWANAVGLMQLLLRTARGVSDRSKRAQVTRRRLHDPAVNIKLGAAYLGFLYHGFGKVPPLAISGYNAGEGATYKWLKRFGRIPLDELIERIPYDQTRNYTKRVLASLFTYATLYNRGVGRVPRLQQRLPRVKLSDLRRGRKKKKRKKARRRKRIQAEALPAEAPEPRRQRPVKRSAEQPPLPRPAPKIR